MLLLLFYYDDVVSLGSLVFLWRIQCPPPLTEVWEQLTPAPEPGRVPTGLGSQYGQLLPLWLGQGGAQSTLGQNHEHQDIRIHGETGQGMLPSPPTHTYKHQDTRKLGLGEEGKVDPTLGGRYG